MAGWEVPLNTVCKVEAGNLTSLERIWQPCFAKGWQKDDKNVDREGGYEKSVMTFPSLEHIKLHVYV